MQHFLEVNSGCIRPVRPQHATGEMEGGLLALFLGLGLFIAPPLLESADALVSLISFF